MKFNTPIFKALLEMRGIRQWQVANVINCDPSYLSKVCRHRLIPENALVVKIAAILKVKPEELILTAVPPSRTGPEINLKTRRRKKADLPLDRGR